LSFTGKSAPACRPEGGDLIAEYETAPARRVDRLIDQPSIQMAFAPVEDGAKRCDHPYAFEPRDVGRVEITHMNLVHGRCCASNASGLRNGHMDLGGIHVAEIPQVEGGVMRDHSEFEASLSTS
jgi:hypothetical protein